MTRGRTRLGDLAPAMKCRNAGASLLSFDIPFDRWEDYERVSRGGVISAELVASIFCVDPKDVAIYAYDPAMAVKITIPRRHPAGGLQESDFDGAQQFAPLLDIEV